MTLSFQSAFSSLTDNSTVALESVPIHLLYKHLKTES